MMDLLELYALLVCLVLFIMYYAFRWVDGTFPAQEVIMESIRTLKTALKKKKQAKKTKVRTDNGKK